VLAQLRLVLGEPEAAWQHFESAIAFNRRIGATAPLLQAQHAYGRSLERGSETQRARGRDLREAAAKAAEQRGLSLERSSPRS
jgi:hypothetical protein